VQKAIINTASTMKNRLISLLIERPIFNSRL
jgi:hypothetical protein